MRLKNFLVVAFLMAFSILFVACGSKEITITLESDFTTVVGNNGKLNPRLVGTDEDLLFVFTSSDPAVLEVDQTGFFRPLTAGESTLTVGLRDNDEVTASVNVKVLAQVKLNDFAPTKIELKGPEKVALNTSEELEAEITPATANKGLFWTSSNEAVATVVNGTVFAHSLGKATITATSVINSAVKATFEVKVAEEGTDAEVLDSAIEYLVGLLPEYVHEGFELPTHPNKDVEVVWKNLLGDVVEEYEFTATEDKLENLSLTVKYGETTKAHTVRQKLVVDLEDNLHEKLPRVVQYLNTYMGVVGNDITGDLLLKEEIEGVKVDWSSNSKNVISDEGKFTRPDNDTAVRLTAIVGNPIANVSQILTFNVNAVGYTAEEKVDYLLTQGSLAPFVNANTSSNLSLPTVDNKFGASLTWVSGSPEIADNNGRYVDTNIEVAAKIKFAVTIKYTVKNYEFEEEVEVIITYNALNDIGRAILDFSDSDFTLPEQVVFGAAPQFKDQLENLPTSVTGHDGVTITWHGKTGEFNTEMKVLVRRITYTPTEVYATFQKEGLNDATISFPINIGIMTGKEDEVAFTARSSAFSGDNYDKLSGLPPQEGGRSGTLYSLGFEAFYFKSRFDYKSGETSLGTRDYYMFFAPGNVKELKAEHLKTVDDKLFVDATLDSTKTWSLDKDGNNVYSPQFNSTARFWKNTTDKSIYITFADLLVLKAQAAEAAPTLYTVFAIDAEGNVTTGNTPLYAPGEGVTYIEIPAGGMVINPANLDGPNLRPFGFKGNKIDVIALQGWTDYTVPTPAS